MTYLLICLFYSTSVDLTYIHYKIIISTIKNFANFVIKNKYTHTQKHKRT